MVEGVHLDSPESEMSTSFRKSKGRQEVTSILLSVFSSTCRSAWRWLLHVSVEA